MYFIIFFINFMLTILNVNIIYLMLVDIKHYYTTLM